MTFRPTVMAICPACGAVDKLGCNNIGHVTCHHCKTLLGYYDPFKDRVHRLQEFSVIELPHVFNFSPNRL